MIKAISTPRMEYTAKHILLAGMLAAPAFLFQPSMLLRWIQVLMFMGFSLITGKKIKILPNLVMILCVTAANLLTPNGKVITAIGGFPITAGAAVNGLDKAALLIGMIYLSRFSIQRGLSIPGRMGSMLSLVFYYFEKILEGERISRGNLIQKIDERLFGLENEAQDLEPVAIATQKTTGLGYAFLGLVVLSSWGLLAAGMLR